jgi:hypothetical protein
MTDFSLKTGDTSPAIKYQLQDDDGNSVGISNFNEIRFRMRGATEPTLAVDDDTAGAVAVTNATEGEVKYEWQSDDTDEWGEYYAEWEVEYSDGTVETFPNDGYIQIEILETLP